MHVLPTPSITHTAATNSTLSLVREYTSVRSFYHDAQELYTRTGYTVSNASGLDHYSYARRILDFCGLHQEHLVITYQAPTNVWPVHTNGR